MGQRVTHTCKRWSCLSSPRLQGTLLIVLTFFVFSPNQINLTTKQHLSHSMKEGQAAVEYLKQLLPPMNSILPPRLFRKSDGKMRLVVTVITVRRTPQYHYLMQVVSRFHRLLVECGNDCPRTHLFICNVDRKPSSHEDAVILNKIFHHTERNNTDPQYFTTDPQHIHRNPFEKEKRDYIYCLEETLLSFSPEYVLLVEDDAVPEAEIFRVLNYLLLFRFPGRPLGGALYIKLYHPERLQNYLNPEPMRILEWLGVGMFVGTIFSLLYAQARRQTRPTWRTVIFFALYSMVLVEVVGRHYLLELRRLSPSLYNLAPATECCTQAMLYSSSSAQRVLGYLSEIQCKPGFAKDTALYSILQQTEEWALVVEPNLVQHIGLFSSLPRGRSK
ncbi:post-GPI attachment to proteins factor 4-like [Pleurodeles waltl]|uniref:post-GPI attachment to proteins factor 4-like n=1 Tax=Pleurodeles waltl TaxID=8319 RepID=UPI003709AFCA